MGRRPGAAAIGRPRTEAIPTRSHSRPARLHAETRRMAGPADRRRSRRVLFKAAAALITGGRYTNDQAFCVCINVSRHGIGLRTGQPPTIGQTVVLRLAIDEE